MIAEWLLLMGSIIVGFLLGLFIRFIIGCASAVLVALFMSGNHELNEFWLAYIIGVIVAEVIEEADKMATVLEAKKED